MIVMLSGTVVYHGVGFLIVRASSGLGYKVLLPEDACHGLSGEVTLYTHEVIREKERELFGFLSIGALELFWKLISVSGVGPKTAQKIVFADPVDHVKTKIMSGDLSFLTDIPGIGKKIAQKIILELKGALVEDPVFSTDTDALEALVGLGYARKDAERILSGIEAGNTEERIRQALKMLGK